MSDDDAYAEGMVEALKDQFEGLPIPGSVIESIRVEGTGPTAEVFILFRHERRPGCLIGFRFPASDEQSRARRDPQWWVPVIWANFDEAISESDCGRGVEPSSDGVVWLKPGTAEDDLIEGN